MWTLGDYYGELAHQGHYRGHDFHSPIANMGRVTFVKVLVESIAGGGYLHFPERREITGQQALDFISEQLQKWQRLAPYNNFNGIPLTGTVHIKQGLQHIVLSTEGYVLEETRHSARIIVSEQPRIRERIMRDLDSLLGKIKGH